MKDPYSLEPETECDPLPLEMRNTVMQTAFTREAKREHLVTLLRRYDRMLRKAEDCLIRVQMLAAQPSKNSSIVQVDMALILEDVSKVLKEDLATFGVPKDKK